MKNRRVKIARFHGSPADPKSTVEEAPKVRRQGLNWEGVPFRYVKGPRDERPYWRTAKRIEKFLGKVHERGTGFSPKQFRDSLQMSKGYAFRWLNWLVDEGIVLHLQRGLYVPNGVQRIWDRRIDLVWRPK
jgi:hypothetical protein